MPWEVVAGDAHVGSDVSPIASSIRSSFHRIRDRLDRFADALFGYDVFIAYRRKDGEPYARGLDGALSARGYSCFIDFREYRPGEPLAAATRRHVAKATVLVVLGTPAILEKRDPDWVLLEIETFLEGKDGTEAKLVPIDFAGTLVNAQANSQIAQRLSRDFLWQREDTQADAGVPTPAIVDAIVGTVGAQRRDRRRLRFFRWLAVLFLVLAIALGAVAVVAFWQWQTALSRLDVVRSQALAADARRLAPAEPLMALKTALEAFETSDSPDAATALLEGLQRVPSLKRYLPCAEGEKAVGVAFSAANDGLLGYACLSFVKNGTETDLRVVDLDGKQKYAATVAGDARNFSFSDSRHLRLSISGKIVALDLQTGQPLGAPTQPIPPPQILNPPDVQQTLEGAVPDCVREHPYSTRYFTSAETADSRLVAYTTEANEIVIADLFQASCVDSPLAAHTHNVLAIGWSPTGRYLASAGAIADGDTTQGVILWDRQQLSSLFKPSTDLISWEPLIQKYPCPPTVRHGYAAHVADNPFGTATPSRCRMRQIQAEQRRLQLNQTERKPLSRSRKALSWCT